MGFNPSRRLKRTAMRAYGWTADDPKSGRMRGLPRANAERNVALAKRALDTRAGK